MEESTSKARRLSIGSANALQRLPQLQDMMKGKRTVIFLDYDGTLTPIVSDPERAILSQTMKDLLNELKKRYTIGVISGRSLAKIKSFVQVDGIFYAGSHGFDIEGPSGCSVRNQVAVHFLPLLGRLRDELETSVASIEGAKVEDNLFALSVHYRNCSPGDENVVEEIVDHIVGENSEIRKGRGKKVFELRPKIEWDKGKALVWLLQALGLDECEDVFTFYIGDDVTDEDAFVVLDPNTSRKGVGVVVTDTTMNSCAYLTLQDTCQVGEFLHGLIEFADEMKCVPAHITMNGQTERLLLS